MDFSTYQLSVTTQGPTYPPSEIMNQDGDFIVIGLINKKDQAGQLTQQWGAAIVDALSPVPGFGENLPYTIKQELDLSDTEVTSQQLLYTLPTPLPCNNYPGVFAPQQLPEANSLVQPSYPLHQAPIPDLEPHDGRKLQSPITLEQWVKAKGQMEVTIKDQHSAQFNFRFSGLIPDSVYTVMALRERDLLPLNRSRPGPLGVPNVFVTDNNGAATYNATMPNPFDQAESADRNRIINVVVLFMSRQMSYGGAIGHHGLGGDIHAQLKLPESSFWEFNTTAKGA